MEILKLRCSCSKVRDTLVDEIQQGRTGKTSLATPSPEALNISSNVDQYSITEFAFRNALLILQRRANETLNYAIRRIHAVFKSERERAAKTRLLAFYLFGLLTHLVRRGKNIAFNLMVKNSVDSLQTEALTAAESLASLNEEFLNRMDSLPLQIGLKNISSFKSVNDFKLKMLALNELRSN